MPGRPLQEEKADALAAPAKTPSPLAAAFEKHREETAAAAAAAGKGEGDSDLEPRGKGMSLAVVEDPTVGKTSSAAVLLGCQTGLVQLARAHVLRIRESLNYSQGLEPQ